jgi:hypothetical protein
LGVFRALVRGSFACAEAPAPWIGPVAFHATAGTLPGCPPEFEVPALQGGTNPMLPTAQCTPCTCGAPSNQDCMGTITINPSGDAACSPGNAPFVANAICKALAVPQDIVSFVGTATVAASAGPCAADGGVLLGASGFAKNALICEHGGGPFGAGCASGVCTPLPPSPFELCVTQAGDIPSCPVEYPARTVVYDNLSDTRDCSPCTCGSPTLTCIGTAHFYTGTNCFSEVFDGPSDGQCQPGGMQQVQSTRAFLTPTNGSCPASGGAASGQATAGAATTVCCKGSR